MSARRPTRPLTPPLEGEDLDAGHGAEARHWIRIYEDLIQFKFGLLDHVKQEVAKLPPVAQTSAAVDITLLETQLAGHHERLGLWHQKARELECLRHDPGVRVFRPQAE